MAKYNGAVAPTIINVGNVRLVQRGNVNRCFVILCVATLRRNSMTNQNLVAAHAAVKSGR